MSTKLYNGIKFKSSNIYVVFEQLKELKEKLLAISWKYLRKEGYLKYFIMENGLLNEGCYEIHSRLRKNLTEELRKIDDIPFNFSVMVYPYQGELYGYYFNDIPEYAEYLTEIADDFSYQDQTDRPEHISKAEYKKRREIWEGILKYYTFVENGLRYDIVSSRNLPEPYSDEFRDTINDIKDEILKDEKEKLKAKIREILKELKGENEDKAE